MKVTDVEILQLITLLKTKGVNFFVESDKLKYRTNNICPKKDWFGFIQKNKTKIIKMIKYKNENIFPLNSLQKAYILGENKYFELGGFPCRYYVEYSFDNYDIGKIENIINEIIREYDALRCFILDEERYYIFNTFPKYRISVFSKDKISAREEILSKKYEIKSWPLFDFYISKTIGSKDVLHFIFNCIILDAWSGKMIIEELFNRYFKGVKRRQEISLYDYNHRDINLFKINSGAEEYWKNEMKENYSFPKLNYISSFMNLKNKEFERLEYRLTKSVTKKIYSFSKKYMCTPTMFICTCFLFALAKYYRNDKISLTLMLNGRKAEIKNGIKAVGEFSNFAILNYIHSNSFINDLNYVKEKIWKILEHIEFDGMRILNYIPLKKIGGIRSPIVFTSMIEGGYDDANKFPVIEEFSISGTPQVALDHHLRMIDGEFMILWDYMKNLFDEKEIKDVFLQYILFIENIVEVL